MGERPRIAITSLPHCHGYGLDSGDLLTHTLIEVEAQTTRLIDTGTNGELGLYLDEADILLRHV